MTFNLFNPLPSKLRIATRKSSLALWQAEFVKQQLLALYPTLHIEIIGITTSGDKILDVPLHKTGGKGLFVKELEDSLLSGEADIAVHSMKDIPANLPKGLEIPVILKRSDPRDVFISNQYKRFKDLPPNARIGTSSLRRQSQLAHLRRDLNFQYLRGNVDTRISKLDEGKFDAIILAAAGIERLNLTHRISEFFETSLILPAVGQGALGIECRRDDLTTKKLIAPLNHSTSTFCNQAERSFNAALGGGCELPVAAFATLKPNSKLELHGLVGSPDGKTILKATILGSRYDAISLGEKLALQLLKLGAKAIIDATKCFNH